MMLFIIPITFEKYILSSNFVLCINGIHVDALQYNAVLTILCPSAVTWETRSWMFCKEKPLWYHCLNDLEGRIVETCLKPKYIVKGEFQLTKIMR